MKEEYKQLLLKDLCARLPYEVQVQQDEAFIFTLKDISVELGIGDVWDEGKNIPIENIKPYLRPMSSMTNEEWNDYKSTWKLIEHDLEDTYEPCIESFDWLNANYFDYRDLISKGLAIEAPEGMYGKEK